MYCPSCGSEITVELNYCNRCGANLSVPANIAAPAAPVRLTGPSVVVGLTIIGALIVILSSAVKLVEIGLNPVALAWIVIFSLATLFGCSALLIRFWSMIIRTQRSSLSSPPVRTRQKEVGTPQQLPPRYEPAGSVTENTTRTFAPIYREPPER